MKEIIVAVAAAIALVGAGSASAAGPQSFWSEDYASAVVLDSAWAETHNVLDADCQGWGGYRLAADGTSSFNRFDCTIWQDGGSSYCLPGECNDPSVVTAYVIRIRSIGKRLFVIIGRRSIG